jgi:LytTR family transcriptional regulator, CO-responsive transcriptional regulator RcoM
MKHCDTLEEQDRAAMAGARPMLGQTPKCWYVTWGIERHDDRDAVRLNRYAKEIQMKDVWNTLNIGQVLLSPDFHVIGINDYAREFYGPVMVKLGNSLFQCHSRKSRERLSELLQKLTSAPADMPRTMVIDVLGKVMMYNLSQLSVVSPTPQTCWSVTFIDVSEQTEAVTNPLSGMLEMKRIPLFEGGSCEFVRTEDVLSIQSEGDYCKIWTPRKSYYLHSSLKSMLQRYASASFFRVHKSFAVNLIHIPNLARDDKGRTQITFDNRSVPPIPVARRKLTALKNAMESLNTVHRQLPTVRR